MSQHLANGASAAENVQKSLATDVQFAKPDETLNLSVKVKTDPELPQLPSMD